MSCKIFLVLFSSAATNTTPALFSLQTDMNQTVESLSLRVVQLQSILCEAEDLQEETDAAKKEIEIDLKQAQLRENGT